MNLKNKIKPSNFSLKFEGFIIIKIYANAAVTNAIL